MELMIDIINLGVYGASCLFSSAMIFKIITLLLRLKAMEKQTDNMRQDLAMLEKYLYEESEGK